MKNGLFIITTTGNNIHNFKVKYQNLTSALLIVAIVT